MVREGIVDVLQWDILSPGLSRWLEFAPNIEAWGRICSPHHYGTMLGNYHLAHLGLSMPNFGFVEWDHASTPELFFHRWLTLEAQADLTTADLVGVHSELCVGFDICR